MSCRNGWRLRHLRSQSFGPWRIGDPEHCTRYPEGQGTWFYSRHSATFRLLGPDLRPCTALSLRHGKRERLGQRPRRKKGRQKKKREIDGDVVCLYVCAGVSVCVYRKKKNVSVCACCWGRSDDCRLCPFALRVYKDPVMNPQQTNRVRFRLEFRAKSTQSYLDLRYARLR